MPGSSSLDLMMADEYARMAGVPYGGPVASSSHNNAEGSSRRKACHDDNNDMTFGHIPMAPPFNSSAGGYSAFTHNLLGLGELAIPHDNGGFYQSFYGGSSSHLVDTPAPTAPTSSEAAESFGVYEFNFPDDLLATIVDTSVPLPAPVESSRVPVDSPVHNLPSTSSSPTAPSAEILVSHPSTPASKKHNTTPSYTPAHTPTATH
ncbi:hypothetical protein BDY19DRAFT_944546 [Irpex rosettiformis]|uniref:Uncharacterized protein n=1 Tax=Irpex rosettiformis TaxID=378272 RepID=A0ACB8U494_9APHY|nr:hypothetical protein BDY19DRAFT_944546 [Irpex rosettiformis]